VNLLNCGAGNEGEKTFHVIEVLEVVKEDRVNSEKRAEANVVLESMQSFDIVLSLHLIKKHTRNYS